MADTCAQAQAPGAVCPRTPEDIFKQMKIKEALHG